MRYHIRERAWSLTEAFVVRDDAGNPVFEVRGKFFHIGDDLVMFDRYSGQELVHIKQRVLSLLPHYEIYRNGQHWASMHEQFKLFGERFKVEGGNGMVFHVNGDIWKWNFTVSDATATCWRKLVANSPSSATVTPSMSPQMWMLPSSSLLPS